MYLVERNLKSMMKPIQIKILPYNNDRFSIKMAEATTPAKTFNAKSNTTTKLDVINQFYKMQNNNTEYNC